MSIRDLFSAFEKADLDSLQNLTSAIKSFNRASTLKKAETRDRSQTILSEMVRKHSIVSFDRGSLKKVKSFDRTDPLYTYSLFQEGCRVYDAQDDPNHLPRELDSLEKLTQPRDDSFNHSRTLSSYEGSGEWTIIFQKQNSPKADFAKDIIPATCCEESQEGSSSDSNLQPEEIPKTNINDAQPSLVNNFGSLSKLTDLQTPQPTTTAFYDNDPPQAQSQTVQSAITISCDNDTQSACSQVLSQTLNDPDSSIQQTHSEVNKSEETDGSYSDTEHTQLQTPKFTANFVKCTISDLTNGVHDTKLPAEMDLSTSSHCDSGFLEGSSSNYP